MSAPSVLIAGGSPSLVQEMVDLGRRAGFATTGACDALEALALLAGADFDLAVVDLALRPMGGIALLRVMRSVSPGTRALAVTANPTLESALIVLNEQLAQRYIETNAEAFAPLAPRVIDALRKETSKNAPECISRAPEEARHAFGVELLTRRELEVASLLVGGLSTAAMAERLALGRGTIANCLTGLYQKLRVRGRSRAAVLLRRLGITEASGRSDP